VRLLLDTHIWLWSLTATRKLHARVRDALADDAHEIWLSPISVWEYLLLAEAGVVGDRAEPYAWLAKALRAYPYRDAPLTREVAIESRRIELPHRDPADRFLVGTARVLDLVLVTSDRRLIAAAGVKVLSNR
jgi:PIN domain nuclease of toxin-antitoxin system